MTYKMWSEVQGKRKKNMGVIGMLRLSCDTMGVKVMKYMIKYSLKRMGCLSMVKIGKRNVVEYHSRKLFYYNMDERQHYNRIFWVRMTVG